MHLLLPRHVTDMNRATEFFMLCLCFKPRKDFFYMFICDGRRQEKSRGQSNNEKYVCIKVS